jgi:hypothetical protein
MNQRIIFVIFAGLLVLIGLLVKAFAETPDTLIEYFGKQGTLDNFDTEFNKYYQAKLTIDEKTGKMTIRLTNCSLFPISIDMEKHFGKHYVPYIFNYIEILKDDKKTNSFSFVRTTAKQRNNSIREILLFENEFVTFTDFSLCDASIWDKILNNFKNNSSTKYRVFASLSFRMYPDNDKVLNAFSTPGFVLDEKIINSVKQIENTREIDKGEEKQISIIFSENRESQKSNLISNLDLNRDTGMLTFSLSYRDEGFIRLDLGKFFGTLNNSIYFQNCFVSNAISDREAQEMLQAAKNSIKDDEPRLFDLECNETIGKQIRITDLSIWQVLSKVLQDNKQQVYYIEFPFSTTIDNKIFQQNVRVDIKYQDVEKFGNLNTNGR